MTARTGLRVFRNRINIERKVLKTVNEALTDCQPLMGLTEKAISRWSQNLNEIYTFRTTALVLEIIKEISIRSKLKTDCSRDVFSNDLIERSVSIKTLYNRLIYALEEVSANS